MPKFRVEFSRTFKESGEVVVEASDDSEAREIASDMLSSDDDSIVWREEGVDMEHVEGATEVGR